MQDLTGKAWGRFQITEERGRGGMAIVYKAYDSALQRTVALKVLLPILASNKEFTRRFRREAITAANLKHPNIVTIYDVGSHADYQYIVMEYLEGPTLQQEIEQKGALPLNRLVPLLSQLAGALDYAHGKGLVHRDIKPANVIIGAHDHVTLTDFGLVKAIKGGKITSEGAAVGTLTYMSPEQVAGRKQDSRSDIYMLGVIVYEMLAGEAPFSGATPFEMLQEIINTPPPPLTQLNPYVSPAVEGVVLKAMSKDPEKRFHTAGLFSETLASAAGLETAATRGAGQTDPLQREVALCLTTPDGREFPVYTGRVTIGRDAANDIIIPIGAVSRYHARIRCEEAGCRVVDAGSTNGTSINGMRLTPGEFRPLGPGDVLQIGPVKLLARAPVSDARGQTGTAIMPAIHD